jgi:hypothetical protein
MALVVASVLAAVAVLHAYWGLFGLGGRSAAIPEVDGRPVFVPTRAACFAVASALLVAAFVLLVRGGYVAVPGAPWLGVAGSASVGVVLVARAVGEFRYVGFFKRVRGSRFAVLDTRLFSPLCLALGVATLWVALS